MIEFDHVGIAVSDLSGMKSLFKELFDVDFGETMNVEKQKVKIAFSSSGEEVELLEADSDSSPLYPMLPHPIKSFIENHGEGLHHLCFKVDDIEAYVEMLTKKGIGLVGEGIMEGNGGHRVCFLEPKKTGGILFELIEK